VQAFQRFCRLARIHEGIRTVQQENIQIIRMQPGEYIVHSLPDIRRGSVIITIPDAAFALQDHLLPHRRLHIHRFGEDLLTASAAIYIRMVKKVDSQFHRMFDLTLCLLHRKLCQSHAAESRSGRGQRSAF